MHYRYSKKAEAMADDVPALPPRHFLGSPSPRCCCLHLYCPVSSLGSCPYPMAHCGQSVNQQTSLLPDSLERELAAQITLQSSQQVKLTRQ